MQCLTPEQERKRDKFLRMRQKKQEEDRTRKEAELEKKRKRGEKQREKEMLQRVEEERRRKEELERQRVEQELRIREAQAPRVPDSFATYRRPGPQEQRYDANDDASSYFVQGPTQPSGFAEFSGMCGLLFWFSYHLLRLKRTFVVSVLDVSELWAWLIWLSPDKPFRVWRLEHPK